LTNCTFDARALPERRLLAEPLHQRCSGRQPRHGGGFCSARWQKNTVQVAGCKRNMHRVLFLLFSAQQAQHYSVRRMRSRMMKSCDQRGLGASPTTSKRQGWYHLALLARLFLALFQRYCLFSTKVIYYKVIICHKLLTLNLVFKGKENAHI